MKASALQYLLYIGIFLCCLEEEQMTSYCESEGKGVCVHYGWLQTIL